MNHHLRIILISWVFTAIPLSTNAGNSLAVARKYAPIFLTEAKRYNIPLAIDFDGDWKAENNAANYDYFLSRHREFVHHPYAKKAPLKPTIYYEFLETGSHYFITYYLFFPFDAGDYHSFEPGHPAGGHNNDTTSLLMAIDKKEDSFYLFTQHHGEISRYHSRRLRMKGGRAVLELTSGNHVLRPLKTERLLKEELPAHRRRIFYYHHGEMREEYRLLRIFNTVWPQRKNTDLFGDFQKEVGIRFKGEDAPWAPWARPFDEKGFFETESGESFFDPVKVFCGKVLKDCSMKYLENPYQRK